MQYRHDQLFRSSAVGDARADDIQYLLHSSCGYSCLATGNNRAGAAWVSSCQLCILQLFPGRDRVGLYGAQFYPARSRRDCKHKEKESSATGGEAIT